MAEKVASLYGELNLEDNMTPSLKKAEGGLSRLGDSLKSAGQKVSNFGGNLLKMSAPIVAGFGIAVNAAMGFDESLTNTAAVLGLTRDQTAALGDQLLQIGVDSQAGPQAVADAYYDIAGGVANAADHMAIMNASIATAEAGNADLGETTRALISVMNSYEFAANDAAYASDVMTRTVGMGVGTMQDLAGAMPQVAGLANSLGIEFEDLGVMMAYLSTKGNTFSESATQISAMMTAMIKPNKEMTDALTAMGYATGQAAIDALGLQGAYQAMVDAGYGDKMAAITGSVEALRGVTALTTPVVDDMADSMVTLGPPTRDAYVAIGGMSNALTSMPNVGVIASGFDRWLMTAEPMGPALRDVNDVVNSMGRAFGTMPDINILATDFDRWGVSLETVASSGFSGFADKFTTGMQGITESTREIQLTSLSAQMRDLTTDMEGLAIATGIQVAPALTQVWEGIKPIIGSIGEWVQKNPEATATIAKLGVVVAGLGTALIPIGALISGIGTALGLITSPVTIAVGVVGGLTLAIIEANRSWANWQNTVRDTKNEILSIQGFSNLQNGLGEGSGGAAGLQNLWNQALTTPVTPAPQQGNYSGSLSDFITSGFNPFSATGKAGGGDFMAGQAITVGENGREVVKFDTGGRVFNRQQMTGGGININTVHVHGVQDPQAMYDAIQRVARERAQ